MTMATRTRRSDVKVMALPFPLGGIDRSGPFQIQPRRGQMATTISGFNVRSYDALAGRLRGGSRYGLNRYIDAQVSGSNLIQGLDVIVGAGYTPPGGTTQTSQSGRVVSLVAISQGKGFVADAGGTAWTAITNDTGQTTPLKTTGPIFSAANQQRLYFIDSANKVYYDPSDNKFKSWATTSGDFPKDTSDRYPRLIATYRGRTVLSGLEGDNHNWFMSAVNDPADWEYSPTTTTASQAVAGNNSRLGKIGDMVTCLIAYSDDRLIIGGDSTIWIMSDDPMDGGRLDLLTDAIGMMWGAPWAKDPAGTIYFVSNGTGIYMMPPNGQPQRISYQIDEMIAAINSGTKLVRLLWNDRHQGLHVFITTTAEATVTDTHYYWEQRTGAWWRDNFDDKNMNPLACCTMDGNRPNDRVALIGSWDGYVRAIDPDAIDDDDKPIKSEVWIGPLVRSGLSELKLKDLEAVLALNPTDYSDDLAALMTVDRPTFEQKVTYAIHVGDTAEEAFNSKAVLTGTWKAGRNTFSPIHRSGEAVYIRLTASKPWALESIRGSLIDRGAAR